MARLPAGQALCRLICGSAIVLTVPGSWRLCAQEVAPPAIEVLESATPGVADFTTYSFVISPAPSFSIAAVDATFRTDLARAMRQINPFDLPTVFDDNNGAIVLSGEDPLADSQFELRSNDATLVLGSAESDTSLSAIFAGLNPPPSSRFTLAHVVLADGAPGMWRIAVSQTDGVSRSMDSEQSGVFGFSAGDLPGDYNADGTVDAADYVSWRDTLGLVGGGLAADGNMNGLIDAGDYELWRANYGRSTAASALAIGVVPEPATWAMVLVWTAVSVTLRKGMQPFQGRMHILHDAYPGRSPSRPTLGW